MLPIILLVITIITAAAALSTMSPMPPVVVYTIAGSDSGGGAGIQADLHAIQTLSGGKVHGCSAITCLTAQNSKGVTAVYSPPVEFLRDQLNCLEDDMFPTAVKVGMLGTKELAEEVGGWIAKLSDAAGDKPLVVVDPVMISTSGHKLIDTEAKAALIKRVFPYADLVTPNKFEAEELLGRKLTTPQDVEVGACDILAMGPNAVLIKGGHSLSETNDGVERADEDAVSLDFAQDYLLTNDEISMTGKPVKEKARLCDGSRGVWLRSVRHDTIHTHGTGCTLSSAIATGWAMGKKERATFAGSAAENIGALSSMHLVDACCIAKAYVNAGIECGRQIGQGPGPVSHTGFPDSYKNFPSIALEPSSLKTPSFISMKPTQSTGASDSVKLGKILPIVDTIELLEKVVAADGVGDIQLRFKDTSDYSIIVDRIKQAQALCKAKNVKLWINDHWKEAIECGGCFGIHLGQEDLAACVADGGLEQIRAAGLAFGVSTHSYSELSAALGVRPSYISLGPIFRTSSKDVKFDSQGLETVRQWRKLICPDVPLVAIGGISDDKIAKAVRGAGAECIAVIGAVTGADDIEDAVRKLNDAMN